MNTKIVYIFLLAIVILFGFYFLFFQKKIVKPSTEIDKKIKITSSFYPLAYLTQRIGGTKVTVLNLTPAGTEPHDYDPNPKDLADLYSSAIFVYNGIGLESWVDKIIPDLQNKNISLIKVSENINIINQDSHIWLDPVLAQQIVINIKNGLVKLDPQNQDYYLQNTDKIIKELISLDTLYQQSLKQCSQKDSVSSHQVLDYLSERYQFKNYSIAGVSPNEEPSSQKMTELSSLVQKKKVKYLLTEPLINSKLADTLSIETGASVLVFNPLEGLTVEEINKGEDYFTVQKQNVINLAKALECQIN